MTTIASLMATDLVTAAAEEPVSAVAKRMASSRVGAVLVVERGRLVGLVSERDLLMRVVANDCDPDTTGIGDIETHDLVTLDVKQSLKDALQVFRSRRFRHLPVLDNGKPVGILSTTDLHSYLVDEFERFVGDLKYRTSLADGIDPYDHFGGQYGR